MRNWWGGLDQTVLAMAGLRLLSASIELTAAICMLLVNDVRKAIAINSVLAIVGPAIFIGTMAIGIYQIAGDVSYGKMVFIALGVVFILVGIYK
ncbi:YqhV family protein [Metabacillus sp. 84]|uniref:YqhV family protein n=1 Tax=unclassified Metabacillus TaxID=2675274 RepID=UPI003CF7F0B1